MVVGEDLVGQEGRGEDAELRGEVPKGVADGVLQVAPQLLHVHAARLPHLELQQRHGACRGRRRGQGRRTRKASR